MARKRYITSKMSVDSRLNRVASQHGGDTALFYTWAICHAGDDCLLHGDAEELLALVFPLRRDLDVRDVRAILEALAAPDVALITWDEAAGLVTFPPDAFYRYQSYIPDGPRRGVHRTDLGDGSEAIAVGVAGACAVLRDSVPKPAQNAADQRNAPISPQISANQRKSAQKRASFNVSSSVSDPASSPVPVPVPVGGSAGGQPPVAPAPPVGGEPREVARDGAIDGEERPRTQVSTPRSAVRAAPKPTTLTAEQNARFRRWYFGEGIADYGGYPLKAKRPDAERAFAKLDPDDALVARMIADIGARLRGRQWSDNAIEHPSTYLNQRIWEDDIQPIHAGRGQPRGGEQPGDRDAAMRAEIARRAGHAPAVGVIDVRFREGPRDVD